MLLTLRPELLRNNPDFEGFCVMADLAGMGHFTFDKKAKRACDFEHMST
jgi:hypothetical protein